MTDHLQYLTLPHPIVPHHTSHYLISHYLTIHYLTVPHNPILHLHPPLALLGLHSSHFCHHGHGATFEIQGVSGPYRNHQRLRPLSVVCPDFKNFKKGKSNPWILVNVATAVSCLEAVPQPGRGLPRAGPDRCEDEVVAGVWPCEYCNMERDLSRALNMIYPSNCAAPAPHAARHPGHFAELSASQ